MQTSSLNVTAYQDLGKALPENPAFKIRLKGEADSIAEAMLARMLIQKIRFPLLKQRHASVFQALLLAQGNRDCLIETEGGFGVAINTDHSALVFSIDGDKLTPHPLPVFLSSWQEAVTNLTPAERRAILTPLQQEAEEAWDKLETDGKSINPWMHHQGWAEGADRAWKDFSGKFLHWAFTTKHPNADPYGLRATLRGAFLLRDGTWITPQVQIQHPEFSQYEDRELSALATMLLSRQDSPIGRTGMTSQYRNSDGGPTKPIEPRAEHRKVTMQYASYLEKDYSAHQRLEHVREMQDYICERDTNLLS